jgi:membrane protein YqaA with SNARE-associated domain
VKVLLATFGVAVASALFPLINIEAYIAGVSALGDSSGVWTLSVVAAAGQAIGKVFWYEIGRTSMNWRYIKKKMESPRWQLQYKRWTERIDDRPWVGMALLFFSATLGFPPLAIMAVLAGQLRFHRFWFYLTTFVGRALRFAAVLGGVGLLKGSGLFS